MCEGQGRGGEREREGERERGRDREGREREKEMAATVQLINALATRNITKRVQKVEVKLRSE